jgi:hypothetical protein
MPDERACAEHTPDKSAEPVTHPGRKGLRNGPMATIGTSFHLRNPRQRPIAIRSDRPRIRSDRDRCSHLCNSCARPRPPRRGGDPYHSIVYYMYRGNYVPVAPYSIMYPFDIVMKTLSIRTAVRYSIYYVRDRERAAPRFIHGVMSTI